jgi:hypothetical protein
LMIEIYCLSSAKATAGRSEEIILSESLGSCSQ